GAQRLLVARLTDLLRNELIDARRPGTRKQGVSGRDRGQWKIRRDSDQPKWGNGLTRGKCALERIAQLARLEHSLGRAGKDILIDKALACQSAEEAEQTFVERGVRCRTQCPFKQGAARIGQKLLD